MYAIRLLKNRISINSTNTNIQKNHVHYKLCTSKIWLLESRFLFYTDCHTLRFLQFFRRGIPESWLCRRYSCSRFGRFPRSSGRCVSWLWVTSRHFRASKVKQMLLFIKNSQNCKSTFFRYIPTKCKHKQDSALSKGT